MLHVLAYYGLQVKQAVADGIEGGSHVRQIGSEDLQDVIFIRGVDDDGALAGQLRNQTLYEWAARVTGRTMKIRAMLDPAHRSFIDYRVA